MKKIVYWLYAKWFDYRINRAAKKARSKANKNGAPCMVFVDDKDNISVVTWKEIKAAILLKKAERHPREWYMKRASIVIYPSL